MAGPKVIGRDILSHEPRKADAHKGQNGNVFVVAGSENYAGAALLTANACEAILRSGADLAIACCPGKIAWAVNTRIPDAITFKFEGKSFSEKDAEKILGMVKEYDVLLIGPGLGKKAREFAGLVVHGTDMPKVIDADAIYKTDLKRVKNAIITPHEKEFKGLLKNSGLTKDNFREHLGSNVLLLKGKGDRIISAGEEAMNKTGNPVMAKGGTGDVLAGLCAGFAAQGHSLFRSACMAAYMNGATGDLLKDEMGETFIASDILKSLHRVYH